MANTNQASTLLLLALLTLISSLTDPSDAADCVGSGAISVYWGQSPNSQDEGTLREACETGNYATVILDGLIVYNDGTTPTLNLQNHCGSGDCSVLQPDIEYCQQNNVKVFLSILEDDSTHPSSSSSNVEKELADYLLNNFLSGQPGPLGSVSLDGIDINDVPDSANLKWDKLVGAINASTTTRKIYISASPQCVYPDYYLNPAIKTGLVDYIWVEFYYQNPCIYSNGDATNLLKAWKEWTSNVPNSLIFLGLAASDKAVSAGYIPPEDLISKVLPTVKEASNYGGVMVWNRYFDKINSYTDQIKDGVGKVCRCVCDESASTSFYGLQQRPGSLLTA